MAFVFHGAGAGVMGPVGVVLVAMIDGALELRVKSTDEALLDR